MFSTLFDTLSASFEDVEAEDSSFSQADISKTHKRVLKQVAVEQLRRLADEAAARAKAEEKEEEEEEEVLMTQMGVPICESENHV